MAIKSTATARFVRISPRKARTIIDMVRGMQVARALDALAFTHRSAAPIVKKLIESAVANARQAESGLDVDGLYVAVGQVDKGPNRNMRRYRPRAQGRATPIVKGISHIHIELSDEAPPKKPSKKEQRIRKNPRPVKDAAPAAEATPAT